MGIPSLTSILEYRIFRAEPDIVKAWRDVKVFDEIHNEDGGKSGV